MTRERRLDAIRRAVGEVVGAEEELASTLHEACRVRPAPPETLAVIEGFRPIVEQQRERLALYIADAGDATAGEARTSGATSHRLSSFSAALRQVTIAFNACVLGYAMLQEMALRLYDPRLREIAPKHLKTYLDAAVTMTRMLPAVIAWELAEEGLHCSCICPMCGLGACGCVALATQTLGAAFRDAVADSAPAGFALQAPKPESELARSGVRAGDVLLAVDGQEVRSIPDIQAAIRRHAVGDELHLMVRRASDSPRELTVRHMSDYPRT